MSQSRPPSSDPHEANTPRAVHVDFGFLTAQTFADRALERELLDLFVTHARRLLPLLPAMTARAQAETAHRLKGSCQGIGAWPAAEAAQRYEDAAPPERAARHADMVAAFAAAEAAIGAHLATN